MAYRVGPAIALLSTLIITAAAACDPPAAYDELPEAGGEDELQFRTTYGSGGGANPPVYNNTCAIGDHGLNELDARGELHDGSVLRGVYPWDDDKKKYSDVALDEVWVDEGGEIRGLLGGVQYQGAQLARSRWVIDASKSGGYVSREMYIHAYRYDADEDIHTYVIAYPSDPSYGQHLFDPAVPLLSSGRSACVPDEDGNIEAVMLGGYHVDLETSEVSNRPDTLGFACLSGAMGKALRWGYRPSSWFIYAEAYETAIRMVRADYCGDGVSWTEPGQAIDIQDKWKIHAWTNPAQFTELEAIWGPKGALCVNTPRLQEQFARGDIVCPGGPPPSCIQTWGAAPPQTLGSIWTRIAPL